MQTVKAKSFDVKRLFQGGVELFLPHGHVQWDLNCHPRQYEERVPMYYRWDVWLLIEISFEVERGGGRVPTIPDKRTRKGIFCGQFQSMQIVADSNLLLLLAYCVARYVLLLCPPRTIILLVCLGQPFSLIYMLKKFRTTMCCCMFTL